MNMTVLNKIYTYGLLLIATTIIGALNFCSAGSYTYSGNVDISLSQGTNRRKITTVEFNIPLIEYKKELIKNQISQVQCKITNYTSDIANTTYAYMNLQLANGTQDSKLIGGFNGNGTYTINYSNTKTQANLLSNQFNLQFDTTNQAINVGFDRECTYIGDNIINQADLGGGQCDYSDYELKTDITENYCKNKFSSLMTQGECNTLYDGYVAPNIYQICTNSLNTCSNELTTCNTTLTSCINGNYTGDVMRSALYINNVQHLSNDNIYITIPEEIERDYVNIDNEADIEITGYGYDQNAMQEMVNTQFTPPSAEDMENIIGKIADFLPLVAIMLLIVYAWWLIKKVF